MTKHSTLSADNHASPLPRILKLAIPVSLQTLISSSLSFVDIYMISSLGDETVAAVGMVNKIYFVAIVAMFGLASGISVLVAQYWGTKRLPEVHALLFAGLTWATLITLPMSFIALSFSGSLAELLTPNANVAADTALYWQWTSPFVFLTGISMILATIQRATNDTFWPMIASVVALISNTLMNWFVLFGPIEALNVGMPGVAVATNLSRLLELLLLAWVLKRHIQPIFRWQAALFKKIWFYGRVLTVQEAFWAGGMFSFFIVYSYMGANELAAMSLMSPIESIFVDLFLGAGVAASILLGQHLGRNEFENAWQLSQYLLTRFPLAACVASLIFAVLALPVIGLFTSISADVKGLLFGVWLAYCVALPAKVHNMIAVIGVLRAGGDNVFVLFVELISIWLIALPLLILLGLFVGWPLWAVVLIAAFEEVGKVLIFRYRIRKKKWLANLTV